MEFFIVFIIIIFFSFLNLIFPLAVFVLISVVIQNALVIAASIIIISFSA